jgi:hypothetical protein
MNSYFRRTFIAALVCASLGNQAQAARKNTPVDKNGRDCITLFESARLQESGAGMYEHFVTAINQCERTIHLHVCYRASKECSALTVAAGGDMRTALGVKFDQPYFSVQWSYDDKPAVGEMSD